MLIGEAEALQRVNIEKSIETRDHPTRLVGLKPKICIRSCAHDNVVNTFIDCSELVSDIPDRPSPAKLYMYDEEFEVEEDVHSKDVCRERLSTTVCVACV